MLTKEHKEIIEIVKGEMNKELKDGCLVKFKKGDNISKNILKFVKKDTDFIKNSPNYRGANRSKKVYVLLDNKGRITRQESIQIIGHYSLSPILKYVNTYFEPRLEEDGKYYELYNGGKIVDSQNESLRIPNEEPLLWTEEQTKNVLKLLKQLSGTKQTNK